MPHYLQVTELRGTHDFMLAAPPGAGFFSKLLGASMN
jgi:hypothetical protein